MNHQKSHIALLLHQVLKQDKRLWEKENVIDQTSLIDLLEKTDAHVIGLLFQEATLRNTFFVQVKTAYVFKMDNFRLFIEEHKVNNSYTAYKNRIGLTDGKRFIDDTKDVVLNFPYKDCVLQGGQTTEEGVDTFFVYEEGKTKTIEGAKVRQPAGYKQKERKRKEVFFNQVLAQDEIDRLCDEKTFVHWKRYTKEGEKEAKSLKRDENGTLRENMIIKGNNLLALHSLKKQFAGKIKLIYIDPPYNTGNDGFKYNDKFNHATWLTFMKNRLEVAKHLLREDGVIFVQCDDNEQAYLKVLMDGVFERENFVVNNVYKRRKTQANLAKHIAPVHEHIICYAKNSSRLKLYNLPLRKEYVKKMYKNPDNDPRGLWRLAPLLQPANSSNKEFKMTMPNGRVIKGKWRCSKETFKKYVEENILYITDEGSPNKKVFLKDNKGRIPNTWLDNISTTEEASKEIENLFGSNSAFSYAKPESLIKHIIAISTQPNDIILDYHLGSGTTAAVAHKMGRQYIGIEQMDYIETIACERMKKVIAGEQGGISKAVKWEGGGDFIYVELAEWNEKARTMIENAESLTVLESFFEEMCARYFLDYNVSIKDFKERVMKEDTFKALSLEEQKRMFLAMLDLNQMYINKSEMYDTRFGVALQDQAMTEIFYQKEINGHSANTHATPHPLADNPLPHHHV